MSLDRLKYDIYKKSGLADYLTFNQFLEQLENNKRVIQTFSELNKSRKKVEKKSKKTCNSKKNDYTENAKVKV